MAQPFRRKRNGKFTGNWIVRLDGGPEVNLKTKNYKEAQDRAKLAAAGEWPRDPEADLRATSADVKAAMNDSAGDAVLSSKPEPVTEKETPPLPLPSDANAPTVGAAPISATADDLNAAAAGVVQDAEGEMAEAMGLSKDEFQAEMAKLAENLPAATAGLYLKVQAFALRLGYAATKGKKNGKRLVVQPVPEDSMEHRVLVVGAKLTLQHLNIDVAAMPWWIVPLAGIVLTSVHQLANAQLEEAAPKASGLHVVGEPPAQPTA